MKCSKCEGTEFVHLLIVLQCTKCETINPTDIDDLTGVMILVNRTPEQRDISFIPTLVKYEDKE